jgi:integrase
MNEYEMYVEHLDDGIRYVQRYKHRLTGQIKRVSVKYSQDTRVNRKLARSALKQRIDAINGDDISSRNITLRVLSEKYLEWQKENVKASTYMRNKRAVASMLRILNGDALVNELTADYVKKKFNATGDSPNTLNERLARFKALMRWGYQEELVESTKCIDRIKRWNDVPHRARIEDKYLEKDELNRLLNWMERDDWRDMTRFIALTGMRFGEAAALTVGDIDLKERTIYVDKSLDTVNQIVTTPKTYASTREIHIQDELLPYAKALCLGRKDSEILFPGTMDGHVQYFTFNNYVKKNTKAAIGRELTTHALRHTHVSLCAEAGMDFDAIARRLGHTHSRITKDIYFHVTQKMKEQDNRAMDSVRMLT